jgi:hypothetical protein
MLRHKINGLRRYLLGRHHQVAFILAVFVVDENDEAPFFDVFDRLIDAVEMGGLCRMRHGLVRAR